MSNMKAAVEHSETLKIKGSKMKKELNKKFKKLRNKIRIFKRIADHVTKKVQRK
ncbi:hypothetical protein ACQKP0_13800 [Heyndrickxia sp. NPDC080065]|uniref:hypothetical protein n=1 Tax=Heyndrickxia sp. NPDC080065 TaxID=3390568 RepID=UPI003D048BC6